MSDEKEYGPAMQALNERQRAFVMALIEFPGIKHAAAARKAGYQNSPGGMRVHGHYLAHSPAVQDAIREEASKRLNASSLTAAGVLMSLLIDEKVEAKDRIRAAGMLLDRSGFGAAQTINVNKTVTRRMDVSAAAQKIAEFRRRFPEQFAKLIGVDDKVIEGEFSEVGQ
jgi:phage terminase small subunit